MDRESMDLAAKGAFLYGAVFFLGLMLSGNKAALICGLIGAGASYVAQVLEAFRHSTDSDFLAKPMYLTWAIAVACGLAGVAAVIGG